MVSVHGHLAALVSEDNHTASLFEPARTRVVAAALHHVPLQRS